MSDQRAANTGPENEGPNVGAGQCKTRKSGPEKCRNGKSRTATGIDLGFSQFSYLLMNPR